MQNMFKNAQFFSSWSCTHARARTLIKFIVCTHIARCGEIIAIMSGWMLLRYFRHNERMDVASLFPP